MLKETKQELGERLSELSEGIDQFNNSLGSVDRLESA
jgi:hypothetical protein